MNQDMHLYIEANQKHGRGYQVHIVIDGIVDSTMADEPSACMTRLAAHSSRWRP